jgi:predicted dehydrogenase
MPHEAISVVRLAVIGAGLIGAKHARLITEIPEAHLVGVADINPAGRSVAGDLGAEYFPQYDEMLAAAKPEGVVVAVPTQLHAQVGVDCARAGIPMIMEKPIAGDLPAARRLVEAAKENNIPLLVGHHRRYNPMVETARRIVQSGGIGRLAAVSAFFMTTKPQDYFQVTWRTQPGGGPVLINLIHDVDNLRYICGEIEEIFAHTAAEIREFSVEDTACVTLRFENGAVGSVLASDAVPSGLSYEQTTGENPVYFKTEENCYRFFGTEATLSFPAMTLTRFVDPAPAGWRHPLTVEQTAVVPEDPLINQLRHFCRVIRGMETPRITGEDALKTLAATLAILESGRRCAPVRPADLPRN